MQLRNARAAGVQVKNSGASRAFVDTDDWTNRYDRGEYCHDPVGGGDGLTDDFYGETAIPRAYAEREWPRFGLTVQEFVADPDRCPQNVIVARRE